MKCKIIILLLLFSFVQEANANSHRDTIQVAKSLIKERKFNQAEKLLVAYHQTNPNDLNTTWLLGQTAYWAAHYNTFRAIYLEAIQQFPSNYYLKLDFALKLLEIGDIDESLSLLQLYQTYDSTSLDVNFALAKINYWQGNIDEALYKLRNPLFKKWKQHHQVETLIHEILTVKSPWIKINANLMHDDQPLSVYSTNLEGGKYINHFFSPNIAINLPLFFQSKSTRISPQILVGNNTQFIKLKTRMEFRAGISSLPSNKQILIGSLELSKSFFKYLELKAGVFKSPYLTTISSLSNTVTPISFSVSSAWNKSSGLKAKLSYRHDDFLHDHNQINTFAAWLLFPLLKSSLFDVNIGYAYSYTHANESRYTSKLTLNELVANSNAGNNQVEGVYNAYFTPNHQQSHAALLKCQFKPNVKLQLGVNASIGFMGKVDNPYLYLDSNTYGIISLNSGYASMKFYPNDISCFLTYKTSEKASFNFNYALLRNNFYTCQTFGITYLTSLWKYENKH